MIIIVRTPVRVSFFGGGTDYPSFYLRKHGAVLGTGIDQYTHVSMSTQSGFFDHKIRIAYSKTELVSSLDEIDHPSVRECLKFRNIDQNLDIHIFSDLPARTGLGSSSSFTVGFLHALYALEGKSISKQRLAEEACHIEQNLIGENVGSQDQFHCAYGGFNIIEFSQSGIAVKPVVAAKSSLQALQDHLMLLYTGITRHASEVVQEQIVKTANLSNDHYLERMGEMVYEAGSLLSQGSIKNFAALLDESWKLKKQLSTKISNPCIDQAYETAKACGAYGGKLCGAGSGGFLALLVPPEKRALIKEQLSGFLEVKTKFDNSGSTIIYMRD